MLAGTALTATSSAAVGGVDDGVGPFHVVGNSVLDARGARFVPYGFVMDCMVLRHRISQLCNGEFSQDPWPASAMLTAAAEFWHANVIRFQVAQEYLFRPNGQVDEHYLSLVDQLVAQATTLHMVSIITLQEERFHAPGLPTDSAVRFWAFMANHFRASPDVLFDLYNEPRLLKSAVGGSETRLWEIWRNGGTVDGIDYVGDQALVDTIRAQGADNVIIAEGNQFDRDLKLLPQYYLSGQNIAYGIEPNLNAWQDTESEWAADYGAIAARVPVFPEAFLPSYEECNRAAPRLLPRLFSYLDSIHMGLIVWTLLPGVTTVGSDLYAPTTFSPSRAPTDACLSGASSAGPASTYGEGLDIWGFYAYHYYFGTP